MSSFQFTKPKESVKSQVEKKVGKKKRVTKKKDPCLKCPLKDKGVFIPPLDVGTPQVLVISDVPLQEDANTMEPFSSATMMRVRKELDALGIGYRLMHLVNCCPEQGHKISAKEMNQCAEKYVKAELEKFDVVLTVGKRASLVALGKKKLTKADEEKGLSLSKLAGNVLINNNTMFVPIYSPVYISYMLKENPKIGAALEKDWLEGISRIKSILDKEPLPFVVKVVGEDNLKEVRSVLDEQETLVVDVETSGLNTMSCVLYTTAVSGLDGDIYLFKGKAGIQSVEDIVKSKVLVMHNAKYDLEVLLSQGLDLWDCAVEDTMLLASLIDATKSFSPFGLKDLARNYLRYKYWRQVIDLNTIGELDDRFVEEYNGEDVFVTRELYKFFIENMLSPKQLDYARTVQSNAIKVMCELELTGIRVDLARVKKEMAANEVRIKELEEGLLGFASAQGSKYAEMNVGSTKQLGEFLMDMFTLMDGTDSGVKAARRVAQKSISKKTGNMSTAEAILKTIVDALDGTADKRGICLQDWIHELLEFRALSKLNSTFFGGFLDHAQEDARIHSSYNMLGTRTGRLSSSSPNLQNIPRGIKYVFVPSDGNVFIDADLSQIEIRIAGIIAKDPVIHEAYNNGVDIHTLTASQVSGVDISQVTKTMRQQAKAVNFGFLYGMGAPSFRGYAKQQYGVVLSEEEAVQSRDGFFKTYKMLGPWHAETQKRAEKYGVIESPFGRVYSFDFNGVDGETRGRLGRQSINYPVQGTASDLNLYIMGSLWAWKRAEGIDLRFVGTVHDSMLMDVDKAMVETVTAKIDEIVSGIRDKFDWVTLPIVMDIELKETNW